MLKIAYHSCYEHPLKTGHRFPMEKYDLLPKQLIHEGTCNASDFFEPSQVSIKNLSRAHTKSYLDKLLNLRLTKSEIRIIGFPLSELLVKRELIITQGTIDACLHALNYGVAMNIAGGTHHAFSNHGEAFCLLNDQAVAALYLLDNKLASKILIVDLDVHQGNGTAEIFKENPAVFTFSMHGEKNYPFNKETSDLDIALPNETNDAKYLNTLYKILPQIINREKPDFIFYQCGVDILESDKLGKLSCSINGCAQRDRFVLELSRKNHIPIMCSMGGGYSPNIKTILEAHANTFKIAKDIYL